MELNYQDELQKYIEAEIEADSKLKALDVNFDSLGEYKKAKKNAEDILTGLVYSCTIEIKKKHLKLVDIVEKEMSRFIGGEIHSSLLMFVVSILWENPSKNIEEPVSKILDYLLNQSPYGDVEDYYVESFIDIWNSQFDTPVPYSTIEKILLKQSSEEEISYGAIIKASSYLHDYSEKEVDAIIDKVKKTKAYQTDNYFRSWID